MKVENAIKRLAQILPIKTTLDALDADMAEVYLAVVNGFYQQGKAPTLAELQSVNPRAAEIVAELGDKDMLTLNDSGEVRGCYPFTMEQRVHRIAINGYSVHAMCAMDALAPSAMFECASVVESECAVTRDPVSIKLNREELVNDDEVGDWYFGINWQAASSCGSCADSLCTEMLFLRDTPTAKAWQADDADNREIFTLPEAMQFASGFFKPLMQQD